MEKTFEEAMRRLEEIVNYLENGDLSLEKSLTLFEEGTKLSAYCGDILKTSEQKILYLTKTGEDMKEGSSDEE